MESATMEAARVSPEAVAAEAVAGVPVAGGHPGSAELHGATRRGLRRHRSRAGGTAKGP